MTGAETKIVHLHVKNVPSKYFVYQPIMFSQKPFFLTVAKTVMTKLSPICQRFDEKLCKIHVCGHLSCKVPYWIGFCCKKSLQA